MALRTRYGYNCQKINFGLFAQIVPVGYVEVVPGETVSGSVAVNMHSAPFKTEITTRVYADAYAFYTPHRLVWDDFPDFISGVATADAQQVPYVTNLWPFNFEQRFVLSSNGTSFNRNTAFQRRNYNLIKEKFFTVQDASRAAATSLDGNTVAVSLQRPSTLETAVLPGIHINDPLLGTTVGSARRAFSEDAFQKMRRYYGDRYVDYLAAIGVKADYNLLEEPELIGQKHTDWKFRRATSAFQGTSPAPQLGQTAGYFASGVNIPVKRTFIPEHGLLAFYVVVRADTVHNATPQNLLAYKDQRSLFWSPEISGVQTQEFDAENFINLGGTPGAQVWQFPQWQEYRMGMNEYGNFPFANASFAIREDTSLKTKDINYYKTTDPAQLLANYDQAILSTNMYQATAQFRLVRNSPVRRVDVRLKVT